MKSTILAIFVLGVCASLCLAATPVSTSQSISSAALNSTATKVYSAANQTDAALWNTYALTTPGTDGVASGNVVFGPGAANTTAYVYGIVKPSGSPKAFTKIYKRTLNATIVGYGNDTTMASVTGTDSTITLTTPSDDNSFGRAVAPGYLALLSYGNDGTNEQVYVNLVTGTSATQYKITSTADVAASTCTGSSNTATTATTYGLGNIWYDLGAGAFLFTYWRSVATTACAAGTAGATTTVVSVMLGGLYTNGTAYYTNPGLAFTPGVAANPVTYLIGGGDNWSNAANIWIVYRDETGDKVYYSKIAKNATAGGSFSALVSDDATADATKTYYPIGVWASDYTYGIAVAVANQTAAAVYNFPIQNYVNGSATAVDSGLSYTSQTTSGNQATMLMGWKLTTGYTLVASWPTSTGSTPVYIGANFYPNGTANGTQTTLGSLQGPVSAYVDLNGTSWVGYTDVDTANGMTYAGYLAKFQGQINAASNGVKLIAITWAAIALIFAALF